MAAILVRSDLAGITCRDYIKNILAMKVIQGPSIKGITSLANRDIQNEEFPLKASIRTDIYAVSITQGPQSP